MRSWPWKGLLGAAVALPALSGAARAQCSDATLTGEYAFGGTAYTPPGLPNGPPAVFEGIKVFDGNGNLTQRDYRGNSLPAVFSPPGSEFGTYTVDPDCTGSLVINHSSGLQIQAQIVISNGGRHIHEVVSTFTLPNGSTPPTQTSVDDWKVESANTQ